MVNRVARHLRKNMTVAEKILWSELRKLRARGYHFRRQSPVDDFIVDFACLSHRLIIEVDGIQHDTNAGRRADTARDADLDWKGFKVLRFRNSDVSQNLDGVMLEILAALGAVVKVE
jgi:very-short-patch-repair endonuclease